MNEPNRVRNVAYNGNTARDQFSRNSKERNITADKSNLKSTSAQVAAANSLRNNYGNQTTARGSGYQSIDQKFSDSYAQKGLQPSVGNRPTIRNEKVSYQTTAPAPFAANDPVYQTAPNNNNIRRVKTSGAPSDGRRTGVAGEVVNFAPPVPEETIPRYRQMPTVRESKRKQLLKKGPSKKKKMKAKVKVTRLNIAILSTGFSAWLVFQLPMAILSAVMFGTALAIDSFFELLKTNPDDGLITASLKGAFDLFMSGINKLSSVLSDISSHLFGVDILAFFDPQTYFFITYAVLMGFFLIQLLIIYMLYLMARLNPLDGEGAGLKTGMLQLALIGYSIPILNIVPWFIFWTIAVWKYPK